MIINRRKLLLAGLISAGALALLLHLADFTFLDLERRNLPWLAGLLCAHLVMITGRGILLRTLAPRVDRAGQLCWVQLAARHQAVFTLAPSGFGDLGFPLLAKHITGLAGSTALRIIAQCRLRDTIALAAIGLLGVVLIGIPVGFGWPVILFTLPLIWFADELAVIFLRVVTLAVPKSRIATFLREAARQEDVSLRDRMVRTLLVALVWSAALAGVMAAFRVLGLPIGLGEAMLFIAAVNLAGALAISIAGLGVTEAGATAALVAVGIKLDEAASIALLVRPLLLVSVVLSSLALDLSIAAIRVRRNAGASTP